MRKKPNSLLHSQASKSSFIYFFVTSLQGLHLCSVTYYNMHTESKNKPAEAILALHTPQPTAHTECLWEHL